EIGDHCSVEDCGQIDFLPFKCDCCNRTFCLEHRSYVAHSCPNAGAKETTVIVCPICAKGMRLKPGQDPSEAFDVHQRTDCDPANYDRVHKKPRCPVSGCKEKLTTINAYRCKHCSQRVCLRHRDPGDHKCIEAQGGLGILSACTSMKRSRDCLSSAAAPSSTTTSATTTTKTTTTSRNRNLNDNGINSSNANPLIPPHLPELCPQCGASFATVERLIQHVEDFHPTAAAVPERSAAAAYRCYFCSRTFHDPVLLVQHSER
ncbi:hypothetical protein VOLCADRAFT_45245, partial [Volvox carteri f. nagariensis]